MKKAKKWMLVLGGVAAFLACAVECSADPFPGIKKGYQVGFYNGELVVSFHSTPLYGNDVPDSTVVSIKSLSFWAEVAGSKKKSREVLCGYRPDEILEGTRMICHVFNLDEAGGDTIKIAAHVQSFWDNRGDRDWSRENIFRSPSLLVPSEIAEGEDGLENDGEPLADADADGVADDIDECADTAEGAEVNESGCVPSLTTAAVVPPPPVVPPPAVVPPGALAPVPAEEVSTGENCALVGTAAFNPALFILLGAALLPIVRSRRK